MNKEEIKHFKSLLKQGSLRHMNILLDDKFQKELQTIIEDYEKLQQENKHLDEVNCKLRKTNERLKDNWIKLRKWIVCNKHNENTKQHYLVVDYGILLGKMQELQGSDNK